MIAKIADRGDNDKARIDAIAKTGMTIGSDGLTRMAYICVACGEWHGTHHVKAPSGDRRLGNCDLCGSYSHLLYPVHCWGGLRGSQVSAAGAADDTESHYGMADAARTATAGHSTQQAARSCDESAKPGTDNDAQNGQEQGKESRLLSGLSCVMTASRLVQISSEIIGYGEMLPEAILGRRTACDIATTLLAVAEKLEQSAYAIEG